MLKKRSRSKQALMADSNQSQIQKQSKPTPFPRLFTPFSSFKSFTTENEAVASPTSILDTKPFSVLKNPFGSDNPKNLESETRLKLEPKRIGLAIVDSLIQEENSETGFSRPRSGTILFGSKLRIQVPDCPQSASDFGIKTKNSPLESNQLVPGSGLGSPRIFTGYFSAGDIDTCVTTLKLGARGNTSEDINPKLALDLKLHLELPWEMIEDHLAFMELNGGLQHHQSLLSTSEKLGDS